MEVRIGGGLRYGASPTAIREEIIDGGDEDCRLRKMTILPLITRRSYVIP